MTPFVSISCPGTNRLESPIVQLGSACIPSPPDSRLSRPSQQLVNLLFPMPHLNWALSILFALCLSCANATERVTRWHMLNVTPREGQADCHLLQLPDGRSVLIDAGEAHDAPGVLLGELKKLRIDRLHLVLISHFHRDHYN